MFVLLLNLAIIIPGLYLLRPHRLVRYMRDRRKVITPRQRFRRASFSRCKVQTDPQSICHPLSIHLMRLLPASYRYFTPLP